MESLNSSAKKEGLLRKSSMGRLQSLFGEIEKEFESLQRENDALRSRVAQLENNNAAGSGNGNNNDTVDTFETVFKNFAKKNNNVAFKTRTKLKQHTSKIVSSFKTPGQTSVEAVKEFRGHRDGIWDVAVSSLGHPILGTASADKTARIWGVDSATCLLVYAGHAGSVNAIGFHPNRDLALTASGDGTAHVWNADVLSNVQSFDSDNCDSGGNDSSDVELNTNAIVVKAPQMTLSGHQGVVIGCQWLDEKLAVTASWDRTANLYNVETGSLLQTLAGHDDELSHVACHPTKRLVATCSADTTFRLWDFRENIHSVSVFQGHTDAVTCAAFSRSDQIVSGSDDRSVKVWDLRNMRAPVTSIHSPSAVNRLSVSQVTGTIAIPHDNRQVVLYDLQGQKIMRLPRADSNKKSHHRMVTSTCWAPASEAAESWRSRANLFSAGFDRVAFGWCVRSNKDESGAASGASNVSFSASGVANNGGGSGQTSVREGGGGTVSASSSVGFSRSVERKDGTF